MNKILVVLAILVVMSAIFVSGCTSQTGSTLGSEEEAGEALDEVSNDISGVLDDLSDMDDELSG